MRKKKKKTRHNKAIDTGLEGFVDWTHPTVNRSAEEREAEMSSLAVGFAARMRKQAPNTQEKTTPGSEGPDEKCLKQSGLAEGV